MLERGTLERDFALSMQALGFGDEPVSYKEARLRPDSHKWAEAEDVEWNAIESYGTFRWITVPFLESGPILAHGPCFTGPNEMMPAPWPICRPKGPSNSEEAAGLARIGF